MAALLSIKELMPPCVRVTGFIDVYVERVALSIVGCTDGDMQICP